MKLIVRLLKSFFLNPVSYSNMFARYIFDRDLAGSVLPEVMDEVPAMHVPFRMFSIPEHYFWIFSITEHYFFVLVI